MADTIKLPAIGIVHSDTAPENTNVWWDDTSIAAPSMADRLKTFDPASKQWQLSSGKVSISNTGGFYGSVAQTADGQVVVIKTSVVGILKGDPDGSLVQAQPGVDYVVPSALNGYVPNSRTLTINGVTQDLTTNRTWTVDALPSQAGNNGKYLTTDGFTASWQTISLASYVPTSRTLTINGVTYDLSANRSWTVSGGVSGLTASRIPYAFDATTVVDSANLVWNNTHNQLQVGGLGVVSSIDVAYFSKVQNNATLLRVLNNTNGTAARASIQVSVNGTSTSFVLSEQATSYISSGILEAGKSTFVASSAQGLNFGTNVPTSVSFWTNNISRASIDSSGNKIFTAGALATNATDGFVYLPSMAGNPSGTPTGVTGGVPVTVDSTNSLFNFYSGGAWKTVVNSSRQLTINGSTYDLSADRTWTIDSLPTQTGNNGKWLTTDGSNASWQTLSGNVSLFTNDAGYITTAALTGYVPYSGATGSLDMGAHNVSATSFIVTGTNGSGHIHLKHQASDASATGSSTVLFANSAGNLKYKSDGGYYVTFVTNGISADRAYTFQNASGTLAFTSDIPSLAGYVPYTGATTNLNLGANNITAQNAYISSLTSGRIPVASTSGQLVDYASLSYSDTTAVLSITKSTNANIGPSVTNANAGNNTYMNYGLSNGSLSATFGLTGTGIVDAGGLFTIPSAAYVTASYLNLGASNATTGHIRFFAGGSTSAEERARILATGQLLVGTTAVTAATDIANFFKNQNGATSVRIYNNTNGTAASAALTISPNNGINVTQLYHTAANWVTSGIFVAGAAQLASSAANGLNVGTFSDTQLSFWTNNTEKGRFLNTGQFLVGRTTLAQTFDIANFEKNQNDYTTVRVTNTTSNTAAGAAIFVGNATLGAYLGYNSAAYTTSGIYIAGDMTLASNVDLNIGTTAPSTNLTFWTNNTQRARIDNNGNKIFTNGALATNATDGFVYIPSCAGVPTGVPTSVTGGVPLVADSTNNKVYAYLGGAWTALN